MGPTSLLPRLENIDQYEVTRQKLHQNQNIIASSSPPWHHHIPPSNSFTAALSSQECFTNAFSALPLSNPISHTLEMHSSFFPFIFVEAYISVQNLAVLSNSALSLMYIFATWASWGSVGSGAQRRAWRERRAVFMVNAGDHWSLSMSFVNVIVIVVSWSGFDDVDIVVDFKGCAIAVWYEFVSCVPRR